MHSVCRDGFHLDAQRDFHVEAVGLAAVDAELVAQEGAHGVGTNR